MNEDLVREIGRARFTPVRLREGYDMGEVDRFLERIVATVSETDRTPPTYADEPPAAAGPPLPSVIQEQRGLWSRLFGRG